MTSSKSSECFWEDNNDAHLNAVNKLKEYKNYQNNNLSKALLTLTTIK